MPAPQQDTAARRAQELLSLLMKQQLGDDYPEVQEMLLKKAEQLLKAAQKVEVKHA